MRKLKTYTLIFLFVAAIFLPYFFYHFSYFPILDDYIQFGAYPLYESPARVYFTIGTLATRPFAGLLDPVFWGRLYSFPGLALFICILLHGFSAFFFHKTAGACDVNLSPLFYLIYLLLPLGTEGRFWLSAATRILPGLFFASAALWGFCSFCKKTSLKRALMFSCLQLFSFGFYETVMVFSALSSLLLCLYFYRKNFKKSAVIGFVITFLNAFFIVFYYLIFQNLGQMASRVSPRFWGNFLKNVCHIFPEIFEIFSHSPTASGWALGLKILLSNGAFGLFLFGVAVLLACVAFRNFPENKKPSKRSILQLIFVGLLLFFLPLLPHTMTKTLWLTNRSLFVSIPGFALILEGFCQLFHRKHFDKILFFLLFFAFLGANINEYDVYLRVGKQDAILVNEIIPLLEDDVLKGKKKLQVVMKEPITAPQNAFYKDHVASVFSSAWALTGALRAESKNLSIALAEPILTGEKIDETAQIIEINFIE